MLVLDGNLGSEYMPHSDENSLRILFDLQACQTEASANRGVGRYSSALFESIASIAGHREVFALTSDNLAHRYEPGNINPAKIVSVAAPPTWQSRRSYDGGNQDALDGIIHTARVQSIKPDVIHVSHVFEGFSDRVGIFDPLQRTAGQIVSATLFDLIPLLFQGYYFQNSEFRRWYSARLAWLRKADLLLAISETSRLDAIRLLGIEPWRISTVYGGISEHFRPPISRNDARNRLLSRFPLREKIVLYTGGDDHRKNIKGAIRAFAKIPPRLRANVQLVIICSMATEREKMYQNEARSHGLGPGDILITGFVSEQDLIDFYGICNVFIFPSFYEGLGLPVLEAMACGAPVIGGENSSIQELIVRKDALFDASRDDSIAERIIQVLGDENFELDLRRYGLTRSSKFSWQQTAKLTLAAFDEATSRSRHAGVQCAITGWLPRKRIAMLTPLPPCRSGIADYNAKFIPYLARHFEIDIYVDNNQVSDELLTGTFRIFNSKDFEKVAASYDLILYEFGNSEFHAHMLPLLDKFPGVVGLHDAYLSGLFGYLDFHKGDKGRYEREMLAAHGMCARHYFAAAQACSNPIGNSMVELPCTKRVLDKALGVISHSPFNLHVARTHYPQGWSSPYRTIPQMVELPVQITEFERATIRSELGFQLDDFVLVSFGHIVWTKWGDRLLEAFLNSKLSEHSKVYLIFAGALAEDDFGVSLRKTIQEAGLGSRIQITGYLSDRDYHKYLQIANLALQLRTKSRGGTPKGVLDCLAYGVPVIVNNDASYTDYPDDIVIKLETEPNVVSITNKLEELFQAQDRLSSYAKKGRQYVAQNHDPIQCAASYASALHEFSAREKSSQTHSWIEVLAPLLAESADIAVDIQQSAHCLSTMVRPTWQRRRLYIDISNIIQSDHETGIQRVVKQIINALYIGNFPGVDALAVVLRDNELFEARDWLAKKGLLASSECVANTSRVEFAPGDVLLMLDSSWSNYTNFTPAFDRARKAKVPIITVVYDLLPIILPPGYFVEGGREWFEGWLRKAIQSSDGLLCISRATANDVKEYVEENCAEKKSLKIGYWHLGSDLSNVRSNSTNSPRTSSLRKKPYLLTVGTIEPRKSHSRLLDIMELLWSRGEDLALCIAGKEGWMVETLMERIRTHSELGNRLFLVESPTDEEISALYQDASGLIFLSIGEGFGLPLVEAAHYGIPIVCSDIPVFREVAGEFATYVQLDSTHNMGEAILKWWNLKQSGLIPDTHKMPKLTWEESAEQMLKVIIEENWLWRKQ